MAEILAGPADDSPVIGAPGRDWLTYAGLRRLSSEVRRQLRSLGVGPQDRVAIVLPNGPEMAAAFLTIAQSAIAAPLNPGLRHADYAFYLADLRAKAVVMGRDYDGPALAAAQDCGVAILRLESPDGLAAGQFRLSGTAAEPGLAGPAGPDDTAMILHTSGTTARPKIVPLLHRNIAASALHIRDALALGASDRCLNVMPLFHIHGLIAGLAASCAAGASVWCAPGFDALRFFGWMQEARPTWYTAVPTMHQAILARARNNAQVIAAHPLRFVRSSSAALPTPVLQALETTFAAPVIEAYGMTEAAHQMTCTPMPPGPRRAGSVGLAAGPLVRIAEEAQDRLTDGPGEVVISGPNVTPGYEANPEANARSFFVAKAQRWFRTGDQGWLDRDGHLTLTGRLKEIINRGGEKISPSEVDAALMDHPAVAQAVAFALPHPMLGQKVAAAVVLHEGLEATEHEIRAFAATRLASFKVPCRVVILTEIPKGPTGKLQRLGLSDMLGLTT